MLLLNLSCRVCIQVPTSLLNNTQDKLELKWLYHGTDASTVPKIVGRGFNRAFAGRNATVFGKGVDFAQHASYSFKFADPDVNNVRRMFMCRVAVGDWCKGRRDQLTPDSKPGTHELFDSTVNSITSPSVFVVYHDSQAYPEYLVTFTV